MLTVKAVFAWAEHVSPKSLRKTRHVQMIQIARPTNIVSSQVAPPTIRPVKAFAFLTVARMMIAQSGRSASTAAATPTTTATRPTIAVIAQAAKYVMGKPAHAARRQQPVTSTSNVLATGFAMLTMNVLTPIT